MKRTILGIATIAALGMTLPSFAADYNEVPELRPAYEAGWERQEDDVRFEFGAAYWYSWGAQNVAPTSGGPASFVERDNTSIADVHGRIDDIYTNTYLLGRAGIGLSSSGTYTLAPGVDGNFGQRSVIGYAGVDYGWLPAGSMREGVAFGGLVGYHYWKENPDTPSVATDMDIHALRLGLRAVGTFEKFDLQSEVAAIPYAFVAGSQTNRAYGVMTETTVGFRPTENISARIGGRAWYLDNTDGTTSANLFRYGLMAELTGRF